MNLKWWPGALGEWSAWSLEDGTFSPFTFVISGSHLGWTLKAVDNRTFNTTLVVTLAHRGYELAHVQQLAEVLRTTFEFPEGEAWLSIDEIKARLARQAGEPARCEFRHAFPVGATDSTVCQCGRITKGLLRRAS